MRRMSGHAASRRALLLAVQPAGDHFAPWIRAHADDVDWAWVVHTAEAHKLLALLAARLAGTGLDDCLDAALRRRLTLARAETAQRAAAAERTLATIAAAFGDAGLPFFVVKGSVLSHQVYGDRLLRRFVDVDIVVHPTDVPRAEARLAALGYRSGGAEGLLAVRPSGAAEQARALTLTRAFEQRHLAAHSWYAPLASDLLPVDLHWHVSPSRLRVDAARLWEQTVAVEIGGTTLRTFTPAATVIHLAAHAATCLLNGFRLLHLVDVGWAATHFADDAAATWQLAERWRIAPYLALVLGTVERLLQVDLALTAAPGAPRHAWPRIAAAQAETFLFDAASLGRRSPAGRLWRELAWGVAVGCTRRNLGVVGDAALARARFKYFRRRQRPHA
ncbi:MAG: nucleotidyltransferase family protein [bacterium]